MSEAFDKIAAGLQDAIKMVDKAGVVAFKDAPTPEGYELIDIANAKGPRIIAKARLLYEGGVDQEGKKERFTVIRLWQTVAGNMIAEAVFCSDHIGHNDIISAAAFGHVDDAEQRLAVMEHFTWSFESLRMKRRLGWQIVQIVD